MLILLVIFVCFNNFIQVESIECPLDWYNFNTSCYKNYPAAAYSSAMDKCFKIIMKQPLLKRPYLTNIESDEELEFVMSLMIRKDIKEIYVGANNIVKRSNSLLWERVGATTLVDKRLLCPDIHIDNSSFFCGFVKNMFYDEINKEKPIIDSSFNQNLSARMKQLNMNRNSFCVNVSDCFIHLPYLCEVNCTNQESICSQWAHGYNNELSPNYTAPSTTVKTKQITTTTTSTTVTTTTTSTSTTSTTPMKISTTKYDPCEFKLDKCINGLCVYDENSIEKYICQCHEGFEGRYCQRDERPCMPHRNKCKNNSTCNQNGRQYNCTCLSGFEGNHCEYNIDDCTEDICKNGGQCEDLINAYRCNCVSFFYGDHCEFKNQELVLKENVSRSFSVFAIFFIIFTYGFFISLDAIRFVFQIEPDGLLEERKAVRKKKLMRKIMEDMKSKTKRKRYRRIINSSYKWKDPFIYKLEKTFRISYDLDLKFIDEDQVVELNGKSISNGSV